jgi:hypothetical protein
MSYGHFILIETYFSIDMNALSGKKTHFQLVIGIIFKSALHR